jgi:hypothetical protein
MNYLIAISLTALVALLIDQIDYYRTKMEWVGDSAMGRNKYYYRYQTAWHIAEWITKVVVFLIVWFALGCSFMVLLRWGTLAAAIAWIASDEYWNLQHHQPLFYPGDGRGEPLELLPAWIAGKTGITLRATKIALKAILLATGAILAAI